jgi:hypothetical protein
MIFLDPPTDTDIISARQFWTGGLETAGPGCYDAVAIARAAAFRLLVEQWTHSAGCFPISVHFGLFLPSLASGPSAGL